MDIDAKVTTAMFYDLNVQWTSARDPELPRMLAFLAELGYDVIALNHTFIGKLPAELVRLHLLFTRHSTEETD